MGQSRLRQCWGEEVCLRLRGEERPDHGRHTAQACILNPWPLHLNRPQLRAMRDDSMHAGAESSLSLSSNSVNFFGWSQND